MHDLAYDELPAIAGNAALNLIRRGADGSLRMSADRWRLVEVHAAAVVFRALVEESGEELTLEVPVADVSRVTWDRLPKQQARSQLRFHLASGDLWTFSGALTEPSGD